MEGIKTAAHAFQHAAGAFATLRDLADRAAGAGDEGPTPDLSKECASMLVALHLAQAQKCFFDKAAADGKSAGLLVKLAQQTHLFYEEMREALLAPLKEHIDRSWAAHAESMSAMFHAEALSRAAKEADDDDETIGPKIARLSRASKTLTDAIKSAKNTPGAASWSSPRSKCRATQWTRIFDARRRITSACTWFACRRSSICLLSARRRW